MSAAYCVADSRYFPRRGRARQLAAPGRPPRADLPARLRPRRRAAAAAGGDARRRPRACTAHAAEDDRPARPPGGRDGPDRHDLIVTRRLESRSRAAAQGRVVAFRNDTERHVPEWGELLDLGPVRTQPYVSFALVAFDRALGTEVLRLLSERQAQIDFERTYWRERRITDYPLLYADQDVLNAILASRVEPIACWRSTRRWRRCRRSPACGSSTSAPCAAPTPTGSSPTSSTTGSPNRGSSRPTTASTRACCAGCWSARSLRSRSPSA